MKTSLTLLAIATCLVASAQGQSNSAKTETVKQTTENPTIERISNVSRIGIAPMPKREIVDLKKEESTIKKNEELIND